MKMAECKTSEGAYTYGIALLWLKRILPLLLCRQFLLMTALLKTICYFN